MAILSTTGKESLEFSFSYKNNLEQTSWKMYTSGIQKNWPYVQCLTGSQACRAFVLESLHVFFLSIIAPLCKISWRNEHFCPRLDCILRKMPVDGRRQFWVVVSGGRNNWSIPKTFFFLNQFCDKWEQEGEREKLLWIWDKVSISTAEIREKAQCCVPCWFKNNQN